MIPAALVFWKENLTVTESYVGKPCCLFFSANTKSNTPNTKMLFKYKNDTTVVIPRDSLF